MAFWRNLFLCRLSQPIHNRSLYRTILRQQPRRLVEVGVSDLVRGQRMIELAAKFHDEVAYTGIDLFEMRPESHPYKSCGLKTAYQKLKTRRAKIRLLPGEAAETVARSANLLYNSDLIVISHCEADEISHQRQLFQRIMHRQSVLMIEQLDHESGRCRYCCYRLDDLAAPLLDGGVKLPLAA